MRYIEEYTERSLLFGLSLYVTDKQNLRISTSDASTIAFQCNTFLKLFAAQ